MPGDTSPWILRYVVMWAALVPIVASTACIGCNDGIAAVGERCDTVADCGNNLQCLDHICKPPCAGHLDCGDGSVCEAGACREIHSQLGDDCESELACGPGQTCRLLPNTTDAECAAETLAAPLGFSCTDTSGCRAGTCIVGRCVALCSDDVNSPDCPVLCDDTGQCRREICVKLPLVSDAGILRGDIHGCLPATGNLTFEIPLPSSPSTATVTIPVPDHALSMVMTTEVLASTLIIGATRVVDPAGTVIYELPDTVEEYYDQPVRHQPLTGVSVLAIPTTSMAPLQHGAYTVDIGTFFPEGDPTMTPRRLRVVEKLGSGNSLELNFYFLDLEDHPCVGRNYKLSAATAGTDPGFEAYLTELRRIFANDISIPTPELFDLPPHPELDGVAASQAGRLFELSTQPNGLSIFFVRSLSPAGLEIAVGGTPGSPLPGTRASGIAIAATALCYQSWPTLARQTAHAIGRHLGLYRNLEPDAEHMDPLTDTTDTAENLMYWGENGGDDLVNEQIRILQTSPVLR